MTLDVEFFQSKLGKGFGTVCDVAIRDQAKVPQFLLASGPNEMDLLISIHDISELHLVTSMRT